MEDLLKLHYWMLVLHIEKHHTILIKRLNDVKFLLLNYIMTHHIGNLKTSKGSVANVFLIPRQTKESGYEQMDEQKNMVMHILT